MQTTVLELLSLLSSGEKRQLFWLACLVAFAAVLETLGVASILPYMAVLATPESPLATKVFSYAASLFGTNQHVHVVTGMGLIVLCGVVAGTAVSGMATFISLRFGMSRIHSITLRMLSSYLGRDYEFFIQRHSSELLRNLLSEVSHVVGGVLTPLIQLFTRIVVILMLLALLLTVNPLVALTMVGVFVAIYLGIYLAVRRHMGEMGRSAVAANDERYRILAELFGGIREAKLWAKEKQYYARFADASARFADLNAKSQLWALLPRYALEIVAFGGVVTVTIILAGNQGGFSQFIPELALYAAAGYKLLPGLQQIYANLAAIRYSLGSLEAVVRESKTWAAHRALEERNIDSGEGPLSLEAAVMFEQVTYTYPGTAEPAVGPIDLRIPARGTVGIMGASGTGKSTVLDLLLGLLAPSSGRILIDTVELNEASRQAWASKVGYVPQSIYLTDATVAENVAFGEFEEQIDYGAVEAALRAAQIYDVVAALPEGLRTRLGERGMRLSGGQRQRIAIARALYREPAILVFDEATSALDSDTEEAVMEAVRMLAHQKTIVLISHRRDNMRNCDLLYELENRTVRLVSEVGSAPYPSASAGEVRTTS